jgi:polar amino acid transport system substrate-binding protein
MKNMITLLFITILVISLASCAKRKSGPINDCYDLKDRVIGNISPASSTESIEILIKNAIGDLPSEVVYFEHNTDNLAALLAGKIDGILLPKFMAEYYTNRNPNLKIIEGKVQKKFHVIMGVRSEDQKLKDDLDSAITKLQDNGTLKYLEDSLITNLPANNEPSNKEIPKIEGAKTIRVGVSGDSPPLDYLAADGRPAGFSVAMLTEIAKMMNINIEFVPVEFQARFTALASKKIDVIFYTYEGKNIPFIDDLKNNNWLGTIPYYKFKGVSFLVRK